MLDKLLFGYGPHRLYVHLTQVYLILLLLCEKHLQVVLLLFHFLYIASQRMGHGNKAGDVEGTLQDNVRDNYCMCDKSRLAFSYAKCACTVYMYRFNNL